MRYLHIVAMGAVLSMAMPRGVVAEEENSVTESDDEKNGSKSPISRRPAGDAPVGSHRDDIVPPEGGFKTDDATRSRGMDRRDPGDVDIGR